MNRHHDVRRNPRGGRQTPDVTVHAREAQPESLERFVEGSPELFAALSSGDHPRGSGECITQLL
jgi:hypothetical protein